MTKTATDKPHRDSIAVELAEIISHESFPGKQYILTVNAPKIASLATAGQFVHIQCSPDLPMRRPLSIMQVSPSQGSVSFLYKVLGLGTKHLAQRIKGETLSLLGPIGNSFSLSPSRTLPLLIGGGVGIPPMIFLAETIKQSTLAYSPFVIMGSEVPFPFTPVKSSLTVKGVDVRAAMPLLEDWQIPSRLASKLLARKNGLEGCFDGYVTELASLWLEALNPEQRQQVEVFSCGPHPMLEAVAELANQYNLPCQVSLEEYMACAVGGCAGCVVEVATPTGPAMKRVCVDGPIFEAIQIFGGS